VGPSGAGKSTFANLIPRFYDAGGGAVLIDGIDIRQMRLRDLRRNIAIVAQEPVLFDDTIYNNILIGNPQATREQVLDAARRAYAHDFINELEKGYETQAGQAGSRLSGGQRQRIALARAFLKDAPVLILDEATSALDAMSEQYIQQALAELMRGRTVIIIAHRFSSIQHADRILVFDQGRIVESGNHTELLDRGGLYANLYRTQSGGLVRD
jgi:subfamily B ATP-binding cassette protein MsbA